MLADLKLRSALERGRGRPRGPRIRFTAIGHAHEPIRKRVGFTLSRVTWLTDSKSVHRCHGCALRLDGMRDLVRDQVLAVAGCGVVGAVAEEQIWTDCERARPERLGGGICITTGVHANVRELRTQRCLELRS